MNDLGEIARVLEVKGAVNARKISEGASNSNGQMQRVLDFQKKLPNHIHHVNEFEWNGAPSMVLVMSTVGTNSGVGIMDRMRKEDGGDLCRAWLCMDVVERKVVGDWKCFGLHVYSFTQHRLLTIATAYVKSTTEQVYDTILQLVERVCGQFGVVVDCYAFISDAEGAVILAVKKRYNVSDDRYQECVFHYHQNCHRVVDATLPAKWRCANVYTSPEMYRHNCACYAFLNVLHL